MRRRHCHHDLNKSIVKWTTTEKAPFSMLFIVKGYNAVNPSYPLYNGKKIKIEMAMLLAAKLTKKKMDMRWVFFGEDQE